MSQVPVLPNAAVSQPRPDALHIVGRFLPGKAEIRIFAVMGQLLDQTGQGHQLIDVSAKSQIRVGRMPAYQYRAAIFE